MCSMICHFLWALRTVLQLVLGPLVYRYSSCNMHCMGMEMGKLCMDSEMKVENSLQLSEKRTKQTMYLVFHYLG